MSALSIVAQENNSGSGLATLLFFLPLMVLLYMLMIRPQRKRMKEQAALQSAIEVGDEVITTSGVYGFITGVEGDRFWLEIDDDVQIRIAKAAIQRKVDTSRPVSSDEQFDGKQLTEGGDTPQRKPGRRPKGKSDT